MIFVRSILLGMAGLLMFFGVAANASVLISLDPQPPKIHGIENIFVDINVSGLDTTLGAFDLEINYDQNVFVPLLVPPAGFGSQLGDIFLGEAIGGIDTSTPGTINLFEVSLLFDFELDALQGTPPIGFTLATLGFFAFSPAAGVPSTLLSTSNIVLSDALGNIILVDANPSARIFVPEPTTLAIFGLGLAGLGFARRRRAA